MRPIIKRSLFSLIILLFGVFQIAAGLKVIVPGEYQLKEGAPSLCGEGFILRTQDDILALGAYHIFSKKFEIDSISEGDFTYKSESRVEFKENAATFIFDTYQEGASGIVYHLTKTATVQNKKITLVVRRIGQDPHTYSCQWLHTSSL